MASAEQQLIDTFRQLAAADQATLLAFAAFLASRTPSTAAVATPGARGIQPPEPVPEPEAIERPAEESVVGALKRLAKTYPMLDKKAMLNATSDLVATALMQGAEPAGVIDKLEEIFATHYKELQSGNGSDSE